MDKIDKNIRKIERRIKYRSLYNFRNFLMRCILKFGIGTYHVSPFILSFLIILFICYKNNNLPFKKDILCTKSITHTIDDSKGSHIEMSSYKIDSFIEYSTKWYLNKDGKYERLVSYFDINNLSNFDINKILSMSYEEINDIFVFRGNERIIKSSLSSDDDIYSEDVIIVSSNNESFDTLLKEESNLDNIIMSMAYLISSLSSGGLIYLTRKILIKRSIKDMLNEYIPYYINYNDEKLNHLLELSIKNNNYINSVPDKTKVLRLGDMHEFK